MAYFFFLDDRLLWSPGSFSTSLDVGDVNGAFAFEDAAIRVVLALLGVLLDDSHALDEHLLLLRQHCEDDFPLAPLWLPLITVTLSPFLT